MKKILLHVSCLVLLLALPFNQAQSIFMPHTLFQHAGDGVLTLFNTHSAEFETIKYKDSSGRYLTEGVDKLNRILRCRLTRQETDMSLKLIELVDNIEDHFGKNRIEVISGYRSSKLNNSLRAEGRKVARNSFHIQGMAIDIRIPGVSFNELRNYVASKKVGGVGFYPGQFVHVDVGPARHW